MIWYLVFTGMFMLYQLDVAIYSVIASIAKLKEILHPEPGNPWFWWWHKDEVLVEAPECDERGYKLTEPSFKADSSDTSIKYTVHCTGGATAETTTLKNGWQIPTAARVSNSSMGSSAIASSSGALGTSFGSVPSDCSGSAAGGSHPSSPQASIGTPKATLQRLLGQQQAAAQPCQLPTVYSLPQPASPDAGSPHNVSAAGLRFRTGGMDDADKHHNQAGFGTLRTRHAVQASAADTSQYQQQLWAAAAAGKDAAAVDIQMSGTPPPSSAVSGPGKSCLLPKSLVAKFDYFPLVLVQLPMYNEEAHCEVVIERACNIAWPLERLIIQVCDDSTREDVKQRIDAKVVEMRECGFNCLVTRRAVNIGFKAGNMINGMSYLNELPWEFVAVFDADFEMPPDFLYQTIWHMQQDSRLGFVQTRWSFTNGYDNMLCWAQRTSLNFHFAVEQRARSFLRTFFGFNGTAGVWRRTAMEQAGGWNMESTVEDMDLSLRAYLNGWKFKYLHWVGCPNELPPTMSAYKTQQYRWNSGPMVVIKQLVSRIWTTDQVTFWDRISCSYFFFRFIYSAFLTIICLMCPAIIIWLDPWEWSWAPMMFLIAGNISAASFIWFAGLLFWPYFLFQTGVGYFRVYAMINGLAGSKKSGTWKVTKKFGAGGLGNRVYHKPYALELLMAVVFLGYAFAAVWFGNFYVLGSFCWIMAWTFLMISFGDYLF